jgi:hypothetical protein
MHTAEELEKFQQGETRHLYAGYRDGRTGLFYLEPGAAHTVRQFAKEHLRCAVISCESPELTTAGPSNRRHGFRHLSAPNLKHGRESDFHIAAKGMIERWAARQDAMVTAAIERDPDGTRQRRADVLVTWPDGAQVAFEPQYSSIAMSNWQTRHQWYADHSIPDIWLFGHSGHQLRMSGAGGLIKLSAVQLAAARTRPVLWVNPHEDLIATIDVSDTKRWNRKEPLRGRLLLIPVSECVLTRGGLEHPEITRCHKKLTALIEATERAVNVVAPEEFGWISRISRRTADEAARQAQAWERGLGARPQEPPPTQLISTSKLTRSGAAVRRGPKSSREIAMEWAGTLEARQVAGAAGDSWLNTDQGRAVAAQIGGWPTSLPMKPVLPLPTHQWQGFVYEHFVLTCAPGARIDVPAAVTAVSAEFAGQELPGTCDLTSELVKQQVEEWFQHAAGVLIERLGPYAFTNMG